MVSASNTQLLIYSGIVVGIEMVISFFLEESIVNINHYFLDSCHCFPCNWYPNSYFPNIR